MTLFLGFSHLLNNEMTNNLYVCGFYCKKKINILKEADSIKYMESNMLKCEIAIHIDTCIYQVCQKPASCIPERAAGDVTSCARVYETPSTTRVRASIH